MALGDDLDDAVGNRYRRVSVDRVRRSGELLSPSTCVVWVFVGKARVVQMRKDRGARSAALRYSSLGMAHPGGGWGVLARWAPHSRSAFTRAQQAARSLRRRREVAMCLQSGGGLYDPFGLYRPGREPARIFGDVVVSALVSRPLWRYSGEISGG